MRAFFVFLVLLCSSGAAWAAPEPIVAPFESWIEPVAIPDANPALRDRPFQTLLMSSQSRYGADHNDHYAEFALLIQNSQGLQALGNITLPWQPDFSDLIIHKVHIVRSGEAIDLLAGGRRFTVLRRESNLESAMLDGVLTAVLQAEGLAVGDILHVAYTVRQRPGALPLRGENLFSLPPGMSARRFYTRQVWPNDIAMRWRGNGPMARPLERRTRNGTELIVDLADAEGPQPPAQAPPRFAFPILLQLTQYRDWPELSSHLAPHYAQAATLGADSPLRAQIDRIAATTAEPSARAMAALRLVQDEVRYFAITLGNGNFLPATADESWARRYGDCKGKTALLIALLNGLGIEAEPVLVNTAAGDILHDSLPQIGMFNHVIVRARIGDRTYWLDGTRTGDRQLEELESSRFGWGLPLRAAGAELERLPFRPSVLPDSETRITYDASRGLLGTVPVSGEMVFRRDHAATMRQLQGQQGEEVMRRMAREEVGAADDSAMQVSHEYDDANGTFTLRFSGTRRTNWTGNSARQGIAYQFDQGAIDWSPDFDRGEGPQRDAPFLLPQTGYLVSTETLILPVAGTGFSIVGEAIDRVIAGVHIRRDVTLENGRAVARMAFRPTQMEIAAADARASVEALRAIREDIAGVRAPAGLLTEDDREALKNRTPTTADEFVQRGYNYLQAGSLAAATADFQRAAELSPRWSRPLSNQAVVEVHRNNLSEAEALLTRAEALDSSDFVVHQARGLIQLRRGRPIQAVTAFTRVLATNPDNAFTLLQRAIAYQQLGELDDALADIDDALKHSPADRDALIAKVRLHVWRNQADQAITAVNALVATDPRNASLAQFRAEALRRLGRADEAARATSEALAIIDARVPQGRGEARELGQLRFGILLDAGRTSEALQVVNGLLEQDPDHPDLLNNRCWLRASANIELERARADCDRALAQEPRNAQILDSRALVHLRQGRWDAAITDASAAIMIEPQMTPTLYIRGLAHLRRGDTAESERDLSAARRANFDVDTLFRNLGLAASPAPAATPTDTPN